MPICRVADLRIDGDWSGDAIVRGVIQHRPNGDGCIHHLRWVIVPNARQLRFFRYAATNLFPFAFWRNLRIMTCSVLLDLDGTLIDSHPGILASCLAALRALGHEPDETLDIKHSIGPPLEDMMQILLQSCGDDRVGEAVAAYRQHCGESGLLGSVPYPGIGNSLREMKQGGLRLYLATSKREAFARRIPNRTSPDNRYDLNSVLYQSERMLRYCRCSC
jgi:Haloacid dehalogenase-like hydrolase